LTHRVSIRDGGSAWWAPADDYKEVEVNKQHRVSSADVTKNPNSSNGKKTVHLGKKNENFATKDLLDWIQ